MSELQPVTLTDLTPDLRLAIRNSLVDNGTGIGDLRNLFRDLGVGGRFNAALIEHSGPSSDYRAAIDDAFNSFYQAQISGQEASRILYIALRNHGMVAEANLLVLNVQTQNVGPNSPPPGMYN